MILDSLVDSEEWQLVARLHHGNLEETSMAHDRHIPLERKGLTFLSFNLSPRRNLEGMLCIQADVPETTRATAVTPTSQDHAFSRQVQSRHFQVLLEKWRGCVACPALLQFPGTSALGLIGGMLSRLKNVQ
jgi:hypothetical protein